MLRERDEVKNKIPFFFVELFGSGRRRNVYTLISVLAEGKTVCAVSASHTKFFMNCLFMWSQKLLYY